MITSKLLRQMRLPQDLCTQSQKTKCSLNKALLENTTPNYRRHRRSPVSLCHRFRDTDKCRGL